MKSVFMRYRLVKLSKNSNVFLSFCRIICVHNFSLAGNFISEVAST